MLLAKKDESMEVTGGIEKNIAVRTVWSKGANGEDIDFDTAALCEHLDGKKELIYYGTSGEKDSLGNSLSHGYLDKPPWIRLDKDERAGGEENLVISKKATEVYKTINLVIWDYKAIDGNKKAHFNTSNLKVKIGNHAEVHPECKSEISDFIHMATIKNDDGKISIINKSKEGNLTAIDDTQMWGIINS